jgi:hypothetical protein
MSARTHFTVVLALLLFARSANAETLPSAGTFDGHFFVDRWGQGVFDYFFVDDALVSRLPKQWRPIRLSSDRIHQWMNPGGAMIKHLGEVQDVAAPPIRIRLAVDSPVIAVGEKTILHVFVENTGDRELDFFLDGCWLSTTVHRRGTWKNERVARDEIYDCSINAYSESLGMDETAKVRATGNVTLGDKRGYIMPQFGFTAVDPNQWPTTIRAKQILDLPYVLESNWLANEYELQAKYEPGDRGGLQRTQFAMSPPLSFDVREAGVTEASAAPPPQDTVDGDSLPIQLFWAAGIGSVLLAVWLGIRRSTRLRATA